MENQMHNVCGGQTAWGNVQQKKPWTHAVQENTFEFRNQPITMQRPSSVRPPPHPSLVPKPADRPGGIWILTLHPPVYSWVFQPDRLSFGRP
jgi:hypothetical protein